jgi:hypothetical protein
MVTKLYKKPMARFIVGKFGTKPNKINCLYTSALWAREAKL